jgi:hypothetical protein
VGLAFLALKPQIGVVAFIAVAGLRHYRWSVLVAGGACLLATVPIAVSGHYGESVSGFLTNLTKHSVLSVNTPPEMTGLVNLLNYFFPNFATPFIELICFLSAIAGAGLAFYRLPSDRAIANDDAQYLIARLSLFVACIFFFIPLHYYDLVALATLLMMVLTVRLPGSYLILFGLLICLRPRNLFNIFSSGKSGDFIFPESHLVSAGLFFLLVGAFLAVLGNSKIGFLLTAPDFGSFLAKLPADLWGRILERNQRRRALGRYHASS